MRRYHLAALTFIAFASVSAVSQTFTIDQPQTKSNKKSAVKVVRPDEVKVSPVHTTPAASNKLGSKKGTEPQPRFEEANPAATTAKVGARRTKRAKKAIPQPAVRHPEVEVATVTPAAVSKPAPPPLEALPSLSRLSTSELQHKIESSLLGNPNIPSASGVIVRVTDTEIHLGGTIANGKEKLEAERLAQSYGGNRLFKDDLQIAGSQSVSASQPVTSNAGIPTTVGNSFSTPKL